MKSFFITKINPINLCLESPKDQLVKKYEVKITNFVNFIFSTLKTSNSIPIQAMIFLITILLSINIFINMALLSSIAGINMSIDLGSIEDSIDGISYELNSIRNNTDSLESRLNDIDFNIASIENDVSYIQRDMMFR